MVGLGSFPSYALSSTNSYSANTLSDISVLALDSDGISLGKRYYVAFTSQKYIAGNDVSLARIYKYNHTLDEWDQITDDSDWICYTSSGGGGRIDFNFARNVLKLHSLGKSMNFVRGCAGTSTGVTPHIVLGIYNATFDPNIYLPTTNSYNDRYGENKGFNLFLSDDAKVLAVYRNGDVYAYEINELTNEWVLSETITTNSKAMAFSEGVLVIGTPTNSISSGGDMYTIYQNANRKYTHHTTTSKEQQEGKQNRQHQQGRIGTNNEDDRSTSSSSFQRVLLGIFAILSLGFVVYQLVMKSTGHSCGFCSRSNTAVNGGGGVHRILVNARLHSRNDSSSSARRTTTPDDHHFDGNNANGNPNEAGETISLNQELQNMNRSIV
jgi:hypothetical protein